tara:strand:+ start:129 stop:623 length:495 start_codon:yes stop_codon:yes gene_type:complete
MGTDTLRAIIGMLPKTDTRREILLKVFLADWKHCLNTGLQITDLDWRHGIHGPENDHLQAFLDLEYSDRPEGEPSLIISALRKIFAYDPEPRADSELTKRERDSINHVLKVTNEYTFAKLIKLVYSVRPIIYSNNSHLGHMIDLSAHAAHQRAEEEELGEKKIA